MHGLRGEGLSAGMRAVFRPATAWSRVQWARLTGTNPLVRRGDRLAVWLLVLAIVSACSVVPVAVGVGRTAEHRAVATAEQQLRTRHRVPVMTIAAASSPLAGPDPGAITAAAHWFWRGHHHGRVVVPAGTKRGAHLLRWVDERGRLTGAPMTVAQARSATGLVALTLWLGFVTMLVILGRAVLSRLDRTHEAAWDRGLERLVRG